MKGGREGPGRRAFIELERFIPRGIDLRTYKRCKTSCPFNLYRRVSRV